MTQPWDKSFRNGNYVGNLDFVKAAISLYNNGWLGEKNVLDAGCGIGTHTILLAEMGFNVTALDISNVALKKLEERISDKPYQDQISLVKGSLDSIPFNDSYFNIVLSTSVIHHGTNEQRNKWLRELARVNKKYGLMILGVLSRNDPRYGSGHEVELSTFVDVSDTFDPEVPHHFYPFNELIEHLQRNEYEVHKGPEELEEITNIKHGPFRHLYIVASKETKIHMQPHLVHKLKAN